MAHVWLPTVPLPQATAARARAGSARERRVETPRYMCRFFSGHGITIAWCFDESVPRIFSSLNKASRQSHRKTHRCDVDEVNITDKLAILADAAKYDASCASSGANKRNSLGTGGIGSTEGAGICHSYTPDGRCVSLLKILLTNFCIFDWVYCVNRVSSNVRRARFTPEEVVGLMLDFYKRNCIEGLFLSSGIIRNGDYTMEQLVEVARCLREDHQFAGYIHLKTIPDAAPELLAAAGRYADRLSITDLNRTSQLTARSRVRGSMPR